MTMTMPTFFNLQTYLMLNAAIACSYVIVFIFMKYLGFNNLLSQSQQLQFARKIFLLTGSIFLIVPVMIAAFPVTSNQLFQFQPFIKQLSAPLLQQTQIILRAPIDILTAAPIYPSFLQLLWAGIVLGSLFFLKNYLTTLLSLSRITKHAYCQRKIKNIHILFTEKINIPFCWSSGRSHYVMIPQILLTKRTDLLIVIRHELQHLRQHDMYWLHLFALLKCFCFWNPFIRLWQKKINELQEFACDEALIIRHQKITTDYAQCLLNTAAVVANEEILPQGGLSILGTSYHSFSLLNRRVTMLFQYKKSFRKKKIALLCAYAACFLTASSLAYAIDSNTNPSPITRTELKALVKKSHLALGITPETVAEVNAMRGSKEGREYMTAALKRMQQYQPYIEAQLKENTIPTNILALPLVESGYNMNSKSAMGAAGIWQFIPSTAKQFGLVVNAERDDRLNLKLSTQAAIAYLNTLYAKYQDWRLALIAYEYGDVATDRLIKQVGSRNIKKLAHSPHAPANLKKFLASFGAAIIFIRHPQLVTEKV